LPQTKKDLIITLINLLEGTVTYGVIYYPIKYFVEDFTQVVDIGCSTGKLLKGMIEQNGKTIPQAQYTGIELEEDFFGDYPHDEEKYHQLNILEVMLESLIFKTAL